MKQHHSKRRVRALIWGTHSLSSSQKLVLLCLAEHELSGHDFCEFRGSDIAWYCSLTPGTVAVILNQLRGLGVVEVKRHPSDGRRLVYTIKLGAFRRLERDYGPSR